MIMATVIHLHDTRRPVHNTAQPSPSTTTPVKDSSHNAASERKEQVQERLWSEMMDGGWVRDLRLLDRFRLSEHTPPAHVELNIPDFVEKEDELYAPLVEYFNTLASTSSLHFVDTSAYYPRQSRKYSHPSHQLPVDNRDNEKSELRPDILGMHKEDTQAFLDSRENGRDTWLYWKLVKVFCEVKPGHTPAEWLAGREQAAMYARQVCLEILSLNRLIGCFTGFSKSPWPKICLWYCMVPSNVRGVAV
jgi:hypothetical protein